MRLVPAAFAVLALLPATASAGTSDPGGLSGRYDCRQTFANYGPTGMPSWVVADRGALRLNTDAGGAATSYDYDAFFLTNEARAGGWSWNGSVEFASGPLARPDEGWSIVGSPSGHPVAMPHDDVRGRTASLVLKSLTATPAEQAPATDGKEGADGIQRSYWYCGARGVAMRRLFARLKASITRVSGLALRLPTWLVPIDSGQTGEKPHVREVKRGLYRVEVNGTGCSCSSLAIVSAKRAPAGELLTLPRVRLARGVRGRAGSVGCGPHSGPANWGPVYCGRNVIVWHQGQVNYAIEAVGSDVSDLVRYANQIISYR